MSPFSFNLSDFVFVWWSLLYEAIPFVALGALVSGIMERCLSREMVARLFPRRRSVGILTVALLGLLLPLVRVRRGAHRAATDPQGRAGELRRGLSAGRRRSSTR